MLELVFCWWVVAMVSADLELSVELARCGAIEDAGERLACFDLLTIRISGPEPESADVAETKTREAASEVESTPVSVAAAGSSGDPAVVDEQSPQSKLDEFGLTPEKTQEPEKLDEITAMVVDLNTTVSGKLVIRLDADQVWLQKDGQRLSLREGDRVRIRQGFGSVHYLFKASGSRSIKVERVE